MALSKTTQDHDEIRQWAEKRGAKPAEVASTERNGQTGILRIEFPNAPHHNDSALKEISWDEFFEKFDANGLSLVYQEVTKEGAESNFNKLIHPDDTKGSPSGSRGAAKKVPAKKTASAKKTAARGSQAATKTTAAKKSSPATGRAKAAPVAAKKSGAVKPAKKSATPTGRGPGRPATKTGTKAAAKKSLPLKTSAKKTPTKNTVATKKTTAPKKAVGARKTAPGTRATGVKTTAKKSR